jgi:diguanylate cyclase (GGDEF)-like protein/PAS domain S-box-containing protein
LNAVTALAPGSSPLRILMVEDDPNDAELIQAYLADARRAGAEVLHARTLAEGLGLLEAHDVQLTLLDLDLPDSHGFNTLERMRAAAAGPVIVISGNGHPSLVDEVLKRRAYDVIPKHELDAATLRRVLRLATLHHGAGQALRTTEGRYRALLASSSEALVLLDATGRVEYCSAAMRPLLGYDAAEAIGQFGVSFVQPEDRDAVQAAFRELRAAPGATSTLRMHFRHKDGSVRALQSTLVNRLDDEDVAAVVCSYRDLSGEEESRARFDATFEHAPVGLAHVDLEGRIRLANRRLCEMLAYSREELLGRTVRELSHPEDLDVTRVQREQLRAGDIPQFTARKRYLSKDGSVVWVQLTVSLARDATGAPLYDVAAFEDISDAMRAELAEQRLRRMFAALSATNEAIVKAGDAQTLYRHVCELLVEHGGLKLAAVRLVDPASGWIDTVAFAGGPASYLKVARISVNRNMPAAHGPTGQAVLEGRTVVSNNYLDEPSLAAWHDAARSAGITAMMSVPLQRAGKPVGLLSLYAAETGWFDSELIGLAERMAQNVSFALDNMDREAARRASEERFRSLTELSSDWYWEQDAQLRFTRFSGGQGDDAWGGDQGAAIGLKRWEIPGLAPLGGTWEQHRAVLEARQPFRNFEYLRVTEDGGRRYVASSGEPVFDAQGEFAGYRGTATDITGRMSSERRMRLEHLVTQELAEATDVVAGMTAALRAICESEGWDRGSYFEVDEDAQLLRFGAGWSIADPEAFVEGMRSIVLARGEGPRGMAWQDGQPLWVPDMRTDPRMSPQALAVMGEMRSAFVFPVTLQGKAIGVLSISARKAREPDGHLLQTLRTLGSQIGLFLQRKRSDEAQRRFRAGMDASADMILLIDPRKMRYVDVNEAVCRTLGYTREEMLAMGPQDILPAKREDLQRTYLKFVADPGAVHGMAGQYRCKDGSHLPFESTRRLLHTNEGPIIVAISRDVRERLESEQALRQSEERFRSLTELSSDWYWEQDTELRFVATSGHDKNRGGITAEQHSGLRRWELPGTEPLEGGWDAHQALLEARRPFRDFMLKRTGNEGDVHYVSVSGEPIFGADGLFRGYRGVAKDITQSFEAVVALRESEERFRNLTALSSDWYWEQDEAFRFTRASTDPASSVFNDVAKVIGRARWELPLTPVSGSWAHHRETLAAHRTFRDFEYSYAGLDGKPRHVSASGYPVFDAKGRFQGYKGIARDITARKLSEGQLRRFRAALDISADSIFLVDIDTMRIIDMNDAGSRNLGYEREELLGAEVTALFADRKLEDVRLDYERLLERGGGEEAMRMEHRRKDGSLFPVEVTRRVLRTAEGRYIVGVARDLSERLRNEEYLRASHERFEIVSRATNDVVWDWNLLTDEIWWNENFRTLFGYGSDEIGEHIDSWTSRIHPEDLGRIKAEVDGAIASGAKAWAGEYRFRCKDGTYLDVYDRGLLTYDANGRAVRIIGAMMDVSERKHAESRMRRHAEHQAAIAGFGQFALDRRSTEELYAAAVRALRCEGVDAVCLMEMFTEAGEFLVRAAQGEGPHNSIGLRGAIAPDSVWPEILRENTSRIAGREYLTSRPLDRPWRAWLRAMGSAVYVPVRDDAKPIAMLCIYSVMEHAFGAEEVRFAETIAHVLSTALQRQKAEQRLAHLAQFDPLTGLPNRALLQERLAQSIVRSRRRQYHAGVLFVDLDRFKLVNDTLGHHQGDALIRQVGERLLACVRPGDTVGRIAGDEFAVVLADMARPDDAALVAQKILDAIARPFDLGGNEAYVGASIGMAAFPDDGDDASTLLKNADIAMYRAKEQGRNGYRFFTAEMNQRTLAKAQLNTDLRRAIERAEFTLHYQPKVNLANGSLCGLEALLRWNHPQRGMVSPAEFIPALEDSGLILPVGEWVIAEACAQLRRWRDAGCAPVPVAVNLSPKQFRRRDLDRLIREALEREGMSAELLELEITESSLMEDPEDAVRSMHNLRAAGLKISIDDFGTGYSSLSYLTRLPLSALKIDRSFVRDAGDSEEAASIVRAVINMAQNLRFTVIAEGVETEQQVAFLRKHGCDQAQGYFFGRPVSAEQTAQRLPRA